MICERCGHEDPLVTGIFTHDCIANLRADLAAAREDLAEVEREDEAREQFDAAIRENTNVMMREALGAQMYSRLWGPELERLGHACDRLRADLEAERARSWELAQHCEELKERIVCWLHFLEVGQQEPSTRSNESLHGALITEYDKRKEAEERAARAEAAAAYLRATLETFVTATGQRLSDPMWMPLIHAQNALSTDSGRDLLTAVRQLVAAASTVYEVERHRGGAPASAAAVSYGILGQAARVDALRDALVDPALAGLQWAGE